MGYIRGGVISKLQLDWRSLGEVVVRGLKA